MRILRDIPAAVIWILTAIALAQELSVTAGIFAAALGAGSAVIWARSVAASRIRLPAFWVMSMGALFLVLAAMRAITQTEFASRLLSPALAFSAGEIMLWFAASLIVAGILRISSHRYRAFLGLEIAAIAVVFAGMLAAHRGGYISRPYALVDRLWLKGYDPVPVFIGIGLLIAFGLIVIVLHRGSSRRLPLHLMLLLVLLAAIFLSFPFGRFMKMPRQGDHATDSNSAFKDQPRPGANPPLAVVVFHDDYLPPLGFYYFRQTAFSLFNGLRLVEDASGHADTDLADSFPAQRIEVQRPPDHESSVPISYGTMVLKLGLKNAKIKPSYRLLDTTVALLAEHTRPFLLISGLALAPKENPDPNRFLRAYDVRSAVMDWDLDKLAERPIGSRQWSKEVREHYLAAPKDSRYAALAGRILETIDPAYRSSPFARALGVKFWLDANGVYSKRSSHGTSRDPLADFLFGNLTGHCVYFAHSAALLMRTLGIPSRVGGGYAVDARNRGEGSALLVRGSNAHAWPEIYISGVGWIPLDIAPAKSLEPQACERDNDLQQMLGEMARNGTGHPAGEPRPAGRGNLRDALKEWLWAFIRCLPYLAAIVLAGLYAGKLYRRRIFRTCRTASLPRLAYRAALDSLADIGKVRSYGETREAFAQSMQKDFPSLRKLTAIHLERALGPELRTISRDECLQLYHNISGEICGTVPWWRRAFAIANPVGWLKVK
jgi:protein-glutamine gamma-glutamyltransferase